MRILQLFFDADKMSVGRPGSLTSFGNAGALVRWNGGFHRVADPFRHPAAGVASLPNAVGSPFDKALVGLFRIKALLKSPDEVLQGPETSTLSRLQVQYQSVPQNPNICWHIVAHCAINISYRKLSSSCNKLI